MGFIIDCDYIAIPNFQQLNMRLESIKNHCVALGYSAEVGPVNMDVQEHAQKITETANTSLEASGRLGVG